MHSELPQPGRPSQALPAWSDDGLLDQIDIAVYALNGRGECRRFNRAAEQLFGYKQSEMLGKNLHEALHSRRPDGSPYPQDECPLVEVSRSGETLSALRETMWARSGEALPVECSVARVVIDGEPGAVITLKDLRPQQEVEASLQSFQDETAEVLRQRDAAARLERELVAAEAMRQRELATQLEHAATTKLRDQQQLLETVSQAVPVGIAVLDAHLRTRWCNRAYRDASAIMRVRRSVAEQPMQETIEADPTLHAIFNGVRETGKPFIGQAYPFRTGQDRETYWNWSLTPLSDGDLLITMQNVTEQTMSQQALVESDKMAAVGRLAASISHEINNPLEAVTNLLYLVHSDAQLSDESRAYVATAETELARVSRIASETLRFHRHAVEPVNRTPKQLVEPVLALYAGKLKSSRVHVSIDFDRAQAVKTFEGDIRQILNNLVGNAIDAMLRGGELRIRTRKATCTRTGRRGLRISVTDNGHGMSAETAAHIFEPFYTTKGASGSGLGLWISHTLAERQGGKLQVRSCREDNPHGKPHGTTFSLFVPSQEQAAATIQ